MGRSSWLRLNAFATHEAEVREIAEKMTEEGDKMNHSTARNVFLSAMRKLARELCKLYGEETTEENVTRISNDPRFQSGIVDILKENYV